MGSFDGLCCGVIVENFGVLILVLVGIKILGCIMNVFGDVIDECGEIGVEELYLIYCFVFSYEE